MSASQLQPNGNAKIYKEAGQPIAVYLVSEQKLVLLFASARAAAIYCRNDSKGNAITCYITQKTRLLKHTFTGLGPLAVRYANTKQLETLGEEHMLCLDDRFLRAGTKIKLYSKMQ